MVCLFNDSYPDYGYFIHCYAAIFLHDSFNCCIALWCHHSVCLTRSMRVCYTTNAVHELPSPLVHLLQWQTCVNILNFLSSMNFDGFHPFAVKNGWQNAVLLWCMLQAGPSSLHYYCAVVLHSCRPLFKIEVSLLSTYKTIEPRFEFLSHSFDCPSCWLLSL